MCLTDLKAISSSVETCTFYYEFYINEHKHVSLMWKNCLSFWSGLTNMFIININKL